MLWALLATALHTQGKRDIAPEHHVCASFTSLLCGVQLRWGVRAPSIRDFYGLAVSRVPFAPRVHIIPPPRFLRFDVCIDIRVGSATRLLENPFYPRYIAMKAAEFLIHTRYLLDSATRTWLIN
jgi:hypothetical protein